MPNQEHPPPKLSLLLNIIFVIYGTSSASLFMSNLGPSKY
jgi:hypothetical protein